MIPPGELASVEDTVLDFRKQTKIGKRIEELDETPALGYDHNFVLNENKDADKKLNLAAILGHFKSGRRMRILTSEPGIQFYTGNFLNGQTGKDGKTYAHRSACCLETQHYPDSVNQPNFPNTVLKPGDKYTSTTQYQFFIAKGKKKKQDAEKDGDK